MTYKSCPRPVHVQDGFPLGQCLRRTGHDGLCDVYAGDDVEVEVIPACACGTINGMPYTEAFGVHGLGCPAAEVPVKR